MANGQYELYQSELLKYKTTWDYAWLTPSELNIIDGYKKNTWEENGNPFLVNHKGDKKGLANDILSRGMYYPFFVKEVDGKYYVILGNHRATALKIYEETKKIKKTFLCISLMDVHFIGNTFYTESPLIKSMRRISLTINQEFFDDEKLKPFKGFNKVKDFEEWIS